jgi:hypothetical protein
MAKTRATDKRLHDGQIALSALELIYPHPPQRQGNIARGSGTMVLQHDGTVCIDGSDVRLTDKWGRPFYLRLKMWIYEGLDEVVDKDPQLVGAFAV